MQEIASAPSIVSHLIPNTSPDFLILVIIFLISINFIDFFPKLLFKGCFTLFLCFQFLIVFNYFKIIY